MRPVPALLSTLLAAGASVAGLSCEGSPAEPRNVLLVTLDTTRADYFGCYGRPGDPTPSFDALAADGILFEQAQSTASVTPVSHASILTGLEQHHHGLRVLSAESGYRLPASVPSLASLLRDRGYATGAVHSAFPVSAHFGLDQGFDHFDSFDAEIRDDGENHSWDVTQFQRRSDETTDRALGYLRERDERPFFLWLHYWDPHDPVLLPPEERMTDLAGINPNDARVYEREVSYVDEQFGRLLAGLTELGLDEDTLVVVTADHGQGLGDHGWYAHRLLYHEQIHVPLILRVPGGPHGVRLAVPVSTVDIAPTILDYLGLACPPVDGISLRGVVEGAAPPARTLYADQVNAYDLNAKMVERRPLDDFLYSVTDGRWKLIYRPSRHQFSELYDLLTDPDETRNLYKRRPDERRRLLAELARRDPWVTAAFPPEGEGPGAAARTALEALGYVATEEGTTEEVHWRWHCLETGEVVDDRAAAGDCPGGWVLRAAR